MNQAYVLSKVREGYTTSTAIAEQYILEHGGLDRYFTVRGSVCPKLRALEKQGYIKRTGTERRGATRPVITWEAVQ